MGGFKGYFKEYLYKIKIKIMSILCFIIAIIFGLSSAISFAKGNVNFIAYIFLFIAIISFVMSLIIADYYRHKYPKKYSVHKDTPINDKPYRQEKHSNQRGYSPNELREMGRRVREGELAAEEQMNEWRRKKEEARKFLKKIGFMK